MELLIKPHDGAFRSSITTYTSPVVLNYCEHLTGRAEEWGVSFIAATQTRGAQSFLEHKKKKKNTKEME